MSDYQSQHSLSDSYAEPIIGNTNGSSYISFPEKKIKKIVERNYNNSSNTD